MFHLFDIIFMTMQKNTSQGRKDGALCEVKNVYRADLVLVPTRKKRHNTRFGKWCKRGVVMIVIAKKCSVPKGFRYLLYPRVKQFRKV